jgi:myosin VI
LQQFFNERILKEEQIIYDNEELGLTKIDFIDNYECIDLFEKKSIGIFDLLDEESRLPTTSCQHFTTNCLEKNRNHFNLDVPRKSKLKSHRELRDDEGFLIKHYAGAVVYSTQLFIEKNNDAFHSNLISLIHESDNGFIKNLFASDADDLLKKNSTGKLNFKSVGSKFRTQLTELLEKLKLTVKNNNIKF